MKDWHFESARKTGAVAPRPGTNWPPLGPTWKDCTVTHIAGDVPLRWRDPARLVHAVEMWAIDSAREDTIANTRCGSFDVPAGESWAGKEELTCWSCAAVERADRPDIGEPSPGHAPS